MSVLVIKKKFPNIMARLTLVIGYQQPQQHHSSRTHIPQRTPADRPKEKAAMVFPADAPPMPRQSNVQYVQPRPTVRTSNEDFWSRVEAVKAKMRTLTTHLSQIASTHQRTLSSPENGSSAQLESMITQTQVLNTSIKDQIKFSEKDSGRRWWSSGGERGNAAIVY